jgi:hypothetical protein
MRARDYWRAVTVDRSDLLDRLLALLRTNGVRFCVIGGQGVNAYAEPVVSLDLDLVLSADAVERIMPALERLFTVESFPHSLNVSSPGSDLRVQIQLDRRYQPFLSHASEGEVLGERIPVAVVEDILQGKVWAALDPERRASKRQKDLADISRLIERQPHLRSLVPREILDRLLV